MDRSQGLFGEGALGGHDPGNAKVRHLSRAVFQDHHIVGFNIPMDDALVMGMLQRLGNLHGKVKGLLPV